MQNRTSPSNPTGSARYWNIVKEVVGFAVRRADEERIAQVAGSLTFTTVLSVVPLVTIIFAVLSALPIFNQMQESLRSLLIEHLMPSNVSDSIFRYLNQFVSKARGMTLIGLVFLAVTAVSTMLTIDRALNTIWRVRYARPLYQRVLVYWAVLTIGPILLGLSLTLTSYLVSASAGIVNKPTFAIALLIDTVPVIVLTFAYAGLYVYVPNRPVAWRDALIGGLAGALAFEVAKRGFAIYIARFPSYTVIYGAVAALPIFLLWVYVSWLITLAGATIAASMPALYGRRWKTDHAPGHDFADALRILRALYEARGHRVPGLALSELGHAVWLDNEHTETLLCIMEAEGIVIRVRPLASGLSIRRREVDVWMFTADAARVQVGRLFRLFAFDGPRNAEIGFASADPLRGIVAASPGTTLEMSLSEIL